MKTKVQYSYKFKNIDKIISKKFLKEYKNELVKETDSFKDTGALTKSFVIRGNSIVSTSSYAGIQDTGGYIRNTEDTKKAMWALFYRTGNTKYKYMALSKKRLFKIKGHKYSSKINMDKIINNISKQINRL